jgi:hypothetical protein
MSKNIPVSVWVNSDLREMLGLIALAERESMSSIARVAIQKECLSRLEVRVEQAQ